MGIFDGFSGVAYWAVGVGRDLGYFALSEGEKVTKVYLPTRLGTHKGTHSQIRLGLLHVEPVNQLPSILERVTVARVEGFEFGVAKVRISRVIYILICMIK